MLQSSTHSPEILKTLLRMQRENKHCDFKLVTRCKTINVHKLIILANSPSFIQNHGSLDNIEELHFPEVLPTVLDSVVYFLYTGKLKVKKSEISLLKSFCVTEGLKSALELLKDYSDVETLSLTVDQLMELPIPQFKDITEEEPANMFVQTNEEKSENAVDIVKQLTSETEEKCSVVTKSGRVSKPTSLKIATVMADKKKTKMKSLMSEIKSKERILNIRKSKKFRSKGPDLKSNSKDQMQRKQKSKHFRSKGTNLKRKAKEQMLKLQKSKNFRSKGVEIKRKVLSRHSVYIRQNRKIHRRINNNNVTDILNIYSDFTESQNSNEPKPMAVNEEFDPYHFHNYALSNNDNSNAAASAADDNGDNDDIANNVQYETEINGENKLNGDKSSNKKKVKQQIKRKTKRYPCPDCDKVLSCKRLLQKHMAEVHQDIVQYETEIDGENKLNGDKSSKEKKVKQQIKRKTKRYPCPDCDKVLSCKRLLQKHMAEVHQDKESIEAYKNLACELCGNIETTYKMLARHVINQHGNRDPKNICLVKKETCRSCGLVLRTITGRIRHEIRHHGMQNKSQLTVSFQCTQCEKKFASYLNLKFHEFHLHGIAPERVTLSHCKVEVSSLAIYRFPVISHQGPVVRN